MSSLPLILLLSLSLAASAQKPVLLASASKPAAAQPPAPKPDPQLAATLARLDAASAKFSSVEANVQHVRHDHLLNSDETQPGIFYVERAGSSAQFGINLQKPNPKILEYKDGVAKVDTPGACYSTYRQAGIDSYVTLGFGGSSKDLADNWQITDLGPETIAGTKTEKLSLIPTNDKVKNTYAKVVIWVDLDRDITFKQVFTGADTDTDTATYTNIRYNKRVDTKPYAIPARDKPCK